MSNDDISAVPNDDASALPGDDVSAIPGDDASALPGEDQQPPEKKKRKTRGILLILLSVVLVCAGVTIGIVSFLPGTKAGDLTDMEGNVVVPDDPSATSSAFLQAADMVTDDGGDGFVIPSVNLHVPLGSVNEVDGVMNPPNFTSAFWIRNRGVSLDAADQGTVYIVAHTARAGKAPGNYVQSNGQILVKNGDFIMANQRTYTVTDTFTVPQDQIGGREELWANTPGMLVFVTCATTTVNLVIVGQLQS